jgi:hypothetical protein
MSSFLLNLARRAAGLPVGAVQAPIPAQPGLEVQAPELDASDTAAVPPAPRAESPAVAPAIPRASREALPPPAIQRAPALAEPAPLPQPATPRTAEPARVARPVVSAETVEIPGPSEVAPVTEPATRVVAPQPSPPPAPPPEPEPTRRAAPRPIVRPSVVAGISDIEPSPDDVPAATAWREQDSPRTFAPVDSQGDRPRPTPVIRPATADSPAPLRLPRPAFAVSPTRTTPPPVHVRIGRIEVRGAPAPTPRQPSSQGAPATLGFAGYTRVRTYRNWPR